MVRFYMPWPRVSWWWKKHAVDRCQVPRGCVAILVGQGQKKERFLLPVVCLNEPLMKQLLHEAGEEDGYDHEGLIMINCDVRVLYYVMDVINGETSLLHHHVGRAPRFDLGR